MFARLACVVACLSASVAYAQTAKQYKAEYEKRVAQRKAEFSAKLDEPYMGKSMTTREHVLSLMKTDNKVKNMRRISHPDSDKTLRVTELVPYIQIDKRNNHPDLFLRFQYSEVHELHVNHFSLKWAGYDGTVPGDALKFERGKTAGRHWQRAAIDAEPYLPILHDMLEADAPVVRFHGKDHFHDHKISDRERQILSDTLLAWYAITLPAPDKP